MDPKYVAQALKQSDPGMSDDLAGRIATNLVAQKPSTGGWTGHPGVYEKALVAQHQATQSLGADATSGAGKAVATAPRSPLDGVDVAGLKKKYPGTYHGRFDETVKRLTPRYVQVSRDQDPEFARRDLEQRLQEDFENPQYTEREAQQKRVQRYQELTAKQMRGEPIDTAHQQWLQQVHSQVEPQPPVDEARRLSNNLAPQLGAGLLMPFTESMRSAAGEPRYPQASTDNVLHAYNGDISRDQAQLLVKKLSGY